MVDDGVAALFDHPYPMHTAHPQQQNGEGES